MIKDLRSSLVAKRVKDLALSLLWLCYGKGLIPGPGTSTCHEYGKKIIIIIVKKFKMFTITQFL